MKNHPMAFVIAAMVVFGSQAVAPADEPAIPDTLKQRVETDGWSQDWHDELYEHEDQAVAAQVRRLLRAKRDEASLKSGLVVHEWGSMKHHVGTFTSEFDLLREDQSDLPEFVKVWANEPVQMIRVIEKPILYFYTDRKQTVNVRVQFPKGVLTQWYPNVASYSPPRLDTGRGFQSNPRMYRNGTLYWSQVELDPDADTAAFAKVDADHPWWHTVRETDATPVRVIDRKERDPKKRITTERFLFYRGAGSYTPTVLPTRSRPGGSLEVRVPFTSPEQIDLTGVFLVRVKGDRAQIAHAPILRGGKRMNLTADTETRPIDVAASTAKAQLTEALEAAGLFPKEAAGLVKIWGDDMFTTPGERLLYLMPPSDAEALLPLKITPAPSRSVRTLISWVEMSTPESEQKIMGLVRQLGSREKAERDAADAELRKIDRFAEAILQRVVRTTTDAGVKLRIEQILGSLQRERQQGKDVPPGTQPKPHLVPIPPRGGGPRLVPRQPLPEPVPAPPVKPQPAP